MVDKYFKTTSVEVNIPVIPLGFVVCLFKACFVLKELECSMLALSSISLSIHCTCVHMYCRFGHGEEKGRYVHMTTTLFIPEVGGIIWVGSIEHQAVSIVRHTWATKDSEGVHMQQLV